MADQTRYYSYVPKGSSQESFKTVSTASYASAIYGDLLPSYHPYTSSIDVKYFYATSEYTPVKKYIYALKNVLNRGAIYSPHFSYSSSLGDKEKQACCLISIPSIFYGSSIEKGSIELSFFVSGSLIAKAEDPKLNGEIIETYGPNSGSVAGVALYKEGFILLTGSWELDGQHKDVYVYSPSQEPATKPKWIYWGAGIHDSSSVTNLTTGSSFDLKFRGTNYVPTITMLAHAEKGELNHSNNPTYIKYGEASKKTPNSSSLHFAEPEDIEIKDTTKYPFQNYSGSLEKQTFITKIGIYDEKKNLIAVAKLAKPIKKTQSRNYTFKLKLDI